MRAELSRMVGGDHRVRSDTAEVEKPNRKERHMTPYGDCVYCGGRIVERPERIDYRYHGQLFILERVPTGVCTQCGEKYFTAEVAKRMEAVASQGGPSVRTVAVPVLEMS